MHDATTNAPQPRAQNDAQATPRLSAKQARKAAAANVQAHRNQLGAYGLANVEVDKLATMDARHSGMRYQC